MPRHHRMEPKASPRRVMAKQRAQQALDLIMGGATYDQAAQQLGYSNRSGAYHAVMSLLRPLSPRSAEAQRILNIERLNKMRLGLRGRQFQGDPEAIAIELRLQEREARYLGLDKQRDDASAIQAALAATQVNIMIQSPQGENIPIGEWRKRMIEQGQSDEVAPRADDGESSEVGA